MKNISRKSNNNAKFENQTNQHYEPATDQLLKALLHWAFEVEEIENIES